VGQGGQEADAVNIQRRGGKGGGELLSKDHNRAGEKSGLRRKRKGDVGKLNLFHGRGGVLGELQKRSQNHVTSNEVCVKGGREGEREGGGGGETAEGGKKRGKKNGLSSLSSKHEQGKK